MRVHSLALWLGIGKGVNLVTYTFALAFLASAFYFYAKCVHLQRQITELTRQMALRDAQQGSGHDTSATENAKPVTRDME